jgi:hypothetical protein
MGDAAIAAKISIRRKVMAELTQEQEDRAAEAVVADSQWIYGTPMRERNWVESGLRAAAPFLQLPWDEPTAEERAGIAFAIGHSASVNECVDSALARFVRERNATLMPKPVDPRLKAIETQLWGAMPDVPEDKRKIIAGWILVALDEI